MSVFGTLRMMQFAGPDQPPHLLPTIAHTAVIIVMIVCMFSV